MPSLSRCLRMPASSSCLGSCHAIRGVQGSSGSRAFSTCCLARLCSLSRWQPERRGWRGWGTRWACGRRRDRLPPRVWVGDRRPCSPRRRPRRARRTGSPRTHAREGDPRDARRHRRGIAVPGGCAGAARSGSGDDRSDDPRLRRPPSAPQGCGALERPHAGGGDRRCSTVHWAGARIGLGRSGDRSAPYGQRALHHLADPTRPSRALEAS